MCGLWDRSLPLFIKDLRSDMTICRVTSLASGRQELEQGLLHPCSVFLPLVAGPLLHLGHLKHLHLRLLSGHR